MKQFLAVTDRGTYADGSLLVLRGVAGLAFMYHGWGKIQNPFGWMGEEAFAPGFLQALAALAEFGGGFCWILGLLTPLASLGIACTMAVATYVHAIMRGDPFVGAEGSYELALVYFSLALLLIANGPGRLSVDRFLFGGSGAPPADLAPAQRKAA